MRCRFLNDSALTLSLAALVAVQVTPPASAQSVNSSAPIEVRGNETRLDVTPSGTPIVVIKAPDDAGVSHNVFSRFNVNREGVIINNSKDIAQSVLGGFVLANPNLKAAGREADLVIAEVLNGDRSNLNGALEMLGTPAGFILANASGITCDGCGFINMPQVTLTTGSVQFGPKGRFSGLLVERGDIRVEGAGLLAGNVDYFDIVSLTSQVNAELFARDLIVSAGAAEFDVELREARSLGRQGTGLAIDSSLLGGMYANRIRIVGNDLGMGVNLNGPVAALEESVDIKAGGDVSVGSLQAAGDVSLASANANLAVSGNVYAGGNTQLEAGDSIAISDAFVGALGNAKLSAGGSITVTNGAVYSGLSQDGALDGSGSIQANAGQTIELQSAQILAAGGINAASANILADAGSVVGGDAINLQAAQNVQSAGFFSSTQGLTIEAGRLVAIGDVQAGTQLSVKGEDIAISGEAIGLDSANASATNSLSLTQKAGLLTNGVAVLEAADISNAGGVLGVQAIEASASDSLSNTGSFASGGELTLAAGGTLNTAGQLSAQGDIAISAAQAELGGSVVSDADIGVDAGSVMLDGTLSSQQNVAIQSSGDLRAGTSAAVTAIGDLALEAEGAVDLSGAIFSGGALSTNAGADLHSNAVIQSIGEVDVAADNVTLEGELRSNSEVTLSTPGAIALDGITASATSIAIDAGGGVNAAQGSQLLSGGALNVTSDKSVVLAGLVSAAGAARVDSAQSLTLSGSASAGGDFELSAEDLLTVSGAAESGQNLTAEASAINWVGSATALSDLSLLANTIDLEADSLLQAVGVLSAIGQSSLASLGSIVGQGGVDLSTPGAALFAGSVQSGSNLSISASDIDSSADFLALGTLVLGSHGNLASDGALTAAGSITASGLNLNFGANSQVQSEENIALDGTSINLAGEWLSLGDISIAGASLENSAALVSETGIGIAVLENAALLADSDLSTNGALNISAAGFVNAGNITALGEASIGATDIKNVGQIAAAGPVAIEAVNALDSSGVIEAGGAVDLSAGGALNLAGTVLSNDAVRLSGEVISIGAVVQGQTALDAVATNDILVAGTGGLFSGSGLRLEAGGLIENSGTISSQANMALIAGTTIASQGNIESGANAVVQGNDIELLGSLQAIGDISINAAQQALISAAIRSDGHLAIAAETIASLGASDVAAAEGIDFAGSSIELSGVWNSGRELNLIGDTVEVAGILASIGDLDIAADELLGVSGELISEGSITLSSPVIDLDGAISAQSSILINGANIAVGSDAAIRTAGLLALASSDSLSFDGLWAGGEGVDIRTGADLTILGRVESGRAALLEAGGAIDISGSLAANLDVELTAAAIDVSGAVESGDAISFTSQNSGQVISGSVTALGDLAIDADGTLSFTGDLASGGALTIEANEVAIAGSAFGGDSLGIDAGTGLVSASAGSLLESAGDITLSAGELTNSGDFAANGAINIDVIGAASLGASVTSSANIEVNAATLNVSGALEAIGDLTLTSDGITVTTAATLQAQNLTLQAASAIDNAGLLFSESTTRIIASGSFGNSGRVEGFGEGVFAANSLTLDGTVVFGGALNVASETLVAHLGQLASNSDLALNAQTLSSSVDARLFAGGNAAINVLSDANLAGQYSARGDFDLVSGSAEIAGTITAGQILEINVGQTLGVSGSLFGETGLNLESGTLSVAGTAVSFGDISVDTAQIETGTGSLIQSGANVTLTTDLGQKLAGMILARADANISAGAGIQIDGEIETGGSIAFDTMAALTGSGTVFSTQALVLNVGSLNWSGDLLSAASANVDVVGNLELAGRLLANGNLAISAQDFELDGIAVADGALTLNAAAANIRGSLGSGGAARLNLSGGLAIGQDAALSSGGLLDIEAVSLANAGLIFADQNLSAELIGLFSNSGQIESGGNSDLITQGDIQSSGSLVSVGSLNLSGSAVSLSGLIQSLSALTANAETLLVDGNISSADALSFTASQLITASAASQVFAEGELALSSGGDLIAAGIIVGEGGVSIDAGADFSLSGSLQSGGLADVRVGDLFDLVGSLQALENLSVSADILNVSGLLASDKTLSLGAGSGTFAASSQIIGLAGIDAVVAGLLTSNGSLGTNGNLDFDIGSGIFSGSLYSGGDARIVSAGAFEQSGNWFAVRSLSVESDAAIAFNGDAFAGTGLTLAANELNLGGGAQLEALGDIGLSALGDLASTAELSANGAVTLSAGNELALSGLLTSSDNVNLTASQSLNSTAEITSAGPVSLIGGEVLLGGTITADDLVSIVSAAGLLTLAGDVSSTQAVSLSAATGLALTGQVQADTELLIDAASIDISGQAYGLGSADVMSGGQLSLVAGGELASLGDIELMVGALNNAGVIDAAGVLGAYVAAGFSNSGTIFAAGELELSSGDALLNTNVISGGGDVTITAGGVLNNAGQLLSFSNLSLTGSSSAQVDGILYGEDSLTASFEGDITTGAVSQLSSLGIFSLSSQGDISLAGVASASGNLTVDAGQALGVSGVLQSESELSLAGANIGIDGAAFSRAAASLNAPGDISISGQLSALASLELNGANIAIGSSANVLSNGTIIAEAAANLNSQGLISGLNDITLSGQTIGLAGRAETAGALAVNAAALLEQSGALEAGSGLSLSGANVEIAGTLLSLDHLTISGASNLTIAQTAQLTSVSPQGANSASNFVSLSGGTVILGGRIEALGNVSAVSAGDLSGTTTLVSEGDISLMAGGLNGLNGEYFAFGNAAIGGQVINIDAAITALGTLRIESTQGDLGLAGSYQSVGNLEVASAGSFALAQLSAFADSGVIYSDTATSLLAADGVENAGTIASLGDLSIQAGALVNNAGTLSGERLLIDAPSFVSTGTLISQQDFSLSAAALTVNGGLISGGDIDLTATSGDLTVNAQLSANAIALTSDAGGLLVTAEGGLASQTSITVAAAGNIEIAGNAAANQSIDIASANGAISIVQDVQVQSAFGAIQLSAMDAIANDGQLAAAGPISLGADAIAAGRISSDGDINFTAQNSIVLTELVDSLTAIDIESAAGSVTIASDGGVIATTTVSVAAQNGSIANQGNIIAGYELNGNIESYNGSISLTGNSLDLGGFVGGSALVLDAASLAVAGTVLAEGTLQYTGEDVSISALGHLHSAGPLDLTLQSFENLGNLTSEASIALASSAGLTNNGLIAADGALGLTAQTQLVNVGILSAGSNITLAASDAQIAGLVTSQLDISTIGETLGVTGTIASGGAINLSATNGIVAADSAIVDAATALILESGGNIALNGILVSDGSVAVTSGGALEIAGQLASFDTSGAPGSLALTAQTIDLSGLVQSGSGARLFALAGNINVSGALVAQSDLSLDAAGGDLSFTEEADLFVGGNITAVGDAFNNAGTLRALGNIDVTSRNGAISNLNIIAANGNIAIAAGTGLIDLGSAGEISGRDVSLTGGAFNLLGSVFANGDLSAQGAAGGSGLFALGGQLSALADVDIDVSALGPVQGTVTQRMNDDYAIFAGENIGLAGFDSLNVNGLLIAENELSITVLDQLNINGGLRSGGDTDLAFSGANVAGDVLAGGELTLSGDALGLSGTLQARGDISGDILQLVSAAGSLIFSEQNVEFAELTNIAVAGNLEALGDITLETDTLAIASAGFVSAGGILDINAKGTGTHTISGILQGVDEVYIETAGRLFVDGTIVSEGYTGLFAEQSIDIAASGQVFASDYVDVVTGPSPVIGNAITTNPLASIAIAGTVASNDIVFISTGLAGGDIVIADTGIVSSSGNARNVQLDSLFGDDANIAINSTGELQIEGLIVTDGSVFVSSLNNDVSLAGDITALGQLVLRSDQGGVDIAGLLSSDNVSAGTIAVNQRDGFTNDGTLSTDGNLYLATGSIENSGLLGANGDLTIVSGGEINNTGTLFSGSDLALESNGALTNDEGLVLALGNIDIDASNVANLSATIESLGGSIDITTGSLTNRIKTLTIQPNVDGGETISANSGAAQIVAAQDIVINATGDVLNSNSSILAGSNVIIAADTLTNAGTGVLVLEERDIIERETQAFVEDAGQNLCPQLEGGASIVPGSCTYDGFFTRFEEYTGNEIVVGTEIVPVTNFLPTVIQAGGTLSITANQLGNGVYADGSAPGGNQSTTPTISIAVPQSGIAPDGPTGGAIGFALPIGEGLDGVPVGFSAEQTIARANSGFNPAEVTGATLFANGAQVAGPDAGNIALFSNAIGSQSANAGNGSAIAGSNDSLTPLGQVGEEAPSTALASSPFIASGQVTGAGNPVGGLSGVNASFNNAPLNGAELVAGLAGSSPPQLPDNSNAIGNAPALFGSSLGQTVVAQPLNVEAIGGSSSSELSIANVQMIGSLPGALEPISGEDISADGVNAINAQDILGNQRVTDAVSGNGGVLNAFSIASIGDFDQIQSGFLFSFLDRFGLAPNQDGLGFDGQNTLFSFNNAPGAEFLFTTNPGFASVGELFDSNFFFDSLGVDRDTNFTRLGDGFFETQFIAEQVRAATNQAQLPQYGNPLDQAQALMDAALAQQQALGLQFGVALTEDQLASLTSSIVWWVTGEVAGTEVLIPVVYLAAADHKTLSNGALLAGTNVVANIAGAIDNIGTIEASNIASINGESITNRDGGQIVGGTVVVRAAQDIINRNATISGGDVALVAGRDVILDTTLSQSVAESTGRSWKNGKRFERETVTSNGLTGQSLVTASGDLSIDAGRDVNAVSAQIAAGGNASLTAGRDINITGLTTSTSTDSEWKTAKRTFGTSNTSSETFNGSSIAVGGDLGINAGRSLDIEGSDIVVAGNALLNGAESLTIGSATTVSTEKLDERQDKRNWETRDITTTTNRLANVQVGGDLALTSDAVVAIRGANVDAGGLAIVEAGNIEISGVIDETSGTVTTEYKKGGLLSSKKETTLNTFDTDTVVQSNLTAGDAALRSSGDITIAGSNVAVDNQLFLDATGNISIEALEELDTDFSKVRFKKSGISIGSGGLFAGVAKNKQDTTTQTTTNIGSLVGSSSGSVSINAGQSIKVDGSQIVAPGVIALTAQDITIQNELDVVEVDTVTKSSSFGLSIGVSAPVLSSATNAVQATEIAANSKNDRVAAVAGLGGAIAATNAADALKDGVLSGVSVNATLGFSKSKSEDSSRDETVIPSLISGGDVALVAEGAGDASTIQITGSDIEATGDLALAAEGAITAEAARENDTSSGSSSSFGVSVGVSVGVGLEAGGASFNGSVNASNSDYQSADTANIESNLTAGGTATVTTPDALTLDGSTLTATRVEVDAGSLDIASRQDTSTYDSSSRGFSVSGSFTPGGPGSISGSVNKGDQSGDFASVQEQAGIFAGEEGFDINVDGATTLQGGVIASEAIDSAQNRLETGSLALADIENREEFSASQVGLSATLGVGGGTNREGEQTSGDDKTRDNNGGISTPLGNLTPGLPTAFSAGGEQSGITRSAIAGGSLIVGGADRSDDGSINRDTDTANDGAIVQEFTDEERAEIADGFAAAQILSAETSVFFANRAAEEKEKRDEAEQYENAAIAAGVALDTDGNPIRDESGNLIALNAQAQEAINLAQPLIKEADEVRDRFGAGSAVRIVATALNGAAGSDVSGSLTSLVQGATVNVLQSLATSKVKEIADSLKVGGEETTQSETVRAALQGLTGCAGAAASGLGDCSAGAVGASASVVINTLLDVLGASENKDLNGDGDFDDPGETLSLEEQEARTNLVTGLVGAIAVTAGIDTAQAISAARIETENNAIVVTEDGELCVRDQATVCNGDIVPWNKVKDLADSTTLKKQYDRVVQELGYSGELTPEQESLVIRVLQARTYSEIDIRFFLNPERADEILRARDAFLTLTDDQRAEVIKEYGSESAAILNLSLTGNDSHSDISAIDLLFNTGPGAGAAGGAGFVYGGAKGTVEGVYETAEGVVTIILNPKQSWEAAKEIYEYAKENPEEFLAGLTEEGKKAWYAFKSDLNTAAYAAAVNRSTTILDGTDKLETASTEFVAAIPVGEAIGPFLVGLGAGGLVLKGSKVAKVVGEITDAANSGRKPDLDDIEADGPETPNRPNGNDRNDNEGERQNESDREADSDRSTDSADRTGDHNDNNDGRNPTEPVIETVEVDVSKVEKGSPEYELLNNPPPNTRIELSNGNVYVTNADGFVDEVSFQPRLIKGKRDSRQTAVGKEGLDTDVGGHIQGCALGGSCDRVNLFPQDANFNNSAYKKFEIIIRNALDEGKDVGPIKVIFVRKDPKSPRPDKVEVTYTIDGSTETIPFKNEAGGGL